jgi:excisionase family DNA binding protein
MASNAPPRLLSIPEVSEMLGGLHEQTVRTLIKRGELGSVTVGTRRMVSVDQVADYIDRHTVDAAS